MIEKIFSYYDQLLSPLPIGYQAVISFALLIFLAWNIYKIVKSGQWIFIAILIVMLPGTWPATKKIGFLVCQIFMGLVTRIQSL